MDERLIQLVNQVKNHLISTYGEKFEVRRSLDELSLDILLEK